MAKLRRMQAGAVDGDNAIVVGFSLFGGGEVVSLTVPVFTKSCHARATVSFGSHTALSASPLKSFVGFGVSVLTGLHLLG